MEITIEDCLVLKDKFMIYCDRAEQHEFPMLFVLHTRMDRTIDKFKDDGIDQVEARAMFRVILKYIGEDYSMYMEIHRGE